MGLSPGDMPPDEHFLDETSALMHTFDKNRDGKFDFFEFFAYLPKKPIESNHLKELLQEFRGKDLMQSDSFLKFLNTIGTVVKQQNIGKQRELTKKRRQLFAVSNWVQYNTVVCDQLILNETTAEACVNEALHYVNLTLEQFNEKHDKLAEDSATQ